MLFRDTITSDDVLGFDCCYQIVHKKEFMAAQGSRKMTRPVNFSTETRAPFGKQTYSGHGQAGEKGLTNLMLRYHLVCWPAPLLLTASLFVYQEFHSTPRMFTFVPVHDGSKKGWCGLGDSHPTVTFLLFNLPMLILMYTMAAYYHFCFEKVQSRSKLLNAIEGQATMQHRSAVIVKAKMLHEFNLFLHGTKILRHMLLLMTVCTLPDCVFRFATIAVGDDLLNVSAVSLFVRKANLILYPCFGIFLFLSLEVGFSLYGVYIEWLK